MVPLRCNPLSLKTQPVKERRKKSKQYFGGDAPTSSPLALASNYSDNCLRNFMNSKKHLLCLLVKYTFCRLFIAAEQEFDKLFTLSLSKSNSQFAFPSSVISFCLPLTLSTLASARPVCICSIYPYCNGSKPNGD